MTFTEPFTKTDNTYNFMAQDPSKMVDGKPAVNKPAATVKLFDQYYALEAKARTITTDTKARYTAFAEAEAFLINHAVMIPYSVGPSGYVVDKLNPLERQYAPYGVADLRMKGLKLLAKPMSNAEFETAYAAWQQERKAALGAVK